MDVTELCQRPLYTFQSLHGNNVLLKHLPSLLFSSFVNYLSVASYLFVRGLNVRREAIQQYMTDLMKL